MENTDLKTRCGFVAIVGRPNVGKSTLLNQLLGEKMSITSRKPQTTRNRLLGIKTNPPVQIIYVDTPGMHLHEKQALNRYMNKEARQSLIDVDVVVFVISGSKWLEEDELVLEALKKAKAPIILAVNKVDLVVDKKALLPHLEYVGAKRDFLDVVPISAKNQVNIDVLENRISSLLPESPYYFPENQVTDRDLFYRMAEIIREKIVRAFGDELPYTSAVEIEAYDPKEAVPFISAIIWLEREGQRPIILGKNGSRIKKIGIRARQDIEKIIGKKVNLKLWIKIRRGWSNNQKIMQGLGYIDLSDGEG